MEKEKKKWHLGVAPGYCDGKCLQFEELRPRVHCTIYRNSLVHLFIHSLALLLEKL